MRPSLTAAPFVTAFLLVAAPAAAHPLGGSGLAHPLSGLDHLLAMLLVGVWAAQQGGRARLALPATFLGLMAAGAGVALLGLPLPAVEPGILASVLVLAALIAAGRRVSLGAGVALTGAFALLHGHAHGAELASGASAATYVAGFLFSTAMLHAAGLGLASLAARLGGALALRAAGVAGVLGGLALLAG